jgi:hypothetical protein
VVKLSSNKRRTGRGRKKERGELGAELPDAVAAQEAPEQEVDGPMDIETDKEKAEPEVKPKLIVPAHLEDEPQRREGAQAEPLEQSKQLRVEQPEAGQKFGGKRVADNNTEGIFEGLTKINESMFSLDGVKKAAAWYIETSEKLANQALEFQERATGWAKDTPFAPLFEAQNSLARKFVERSANAARTLWQIEQPVH